MHNVSEDELLALQAHVEVEASQWQKLKKRILIRTLIVIGLILFRLLILKLYPETYIPLVFDGAGLDAAELGELITGRLLSGVVLSCVYLYALITNSYLRSVSIIALIVPISLMWADLQMFLVSSFPDFTLVVSISFAMRVLAVYLLLLNYLDIRR